ncbi:MAG TPA: DNA cytosine methyltransferase [Oligoflexus sp.]|uniref:DNA cytosine methyltransferase n=1 Tax=Oligoflexus sp. TaxID=1971216 RepID=UPI002D34EC6E|nr:DNA cytosine methyltransferase [Oligoflexus sp.]HYX32514.1 DNA cytosine methyltransferase [Oligoflexus sp.]
MRPGLIQSKLQRYAAGESLRVLDLFAGCGGMSLGFHRAGFEIAAAIEFDRLAAASHALNFEGLTLAEVSSKTANFARDITTTPPAEAVAHRQQPLAEAIDIIIGGPPCQAFARVGRAKLREIQDHPDAYLRDPRAQLYLSYLEYVQALKPLAVLVENVPDVLNHGGLNIAHEICESLQELGYDCRYTLLNSVHYGVPQMRERMFLLAVRKELKQTITFPQPTHYLQLPKGYAGTRRTALKTLEKLAHSDSFFDETPLPDPHLPAAVTAAEALADLPLITGHLDGSLKRGARRFTEGVAYHDRDPSAYGFLMRHWPGFESTGSISDHVIRSLPRDYKIFRAMKAGDQYPEAVAVAEKLLKAEATRQRLTTQSKAYKDLRKDFVPPYDPGKFPNKWRKMSAAEPARTLMAHLGKDSYSHIHYDGQQARTISVREAARLQSFPDGFRFVGTMNPAFKQIGNAVPPLMAYALAQTIKAALDAVAARSLYERRHDPRAETELHAAYPGSSHRT